MWKLRKIAVVLIALFFFFIWLLKGGRRHSGNDLDHSEAAMVTLAGKFIVPPSTMQYNLTNPKASDFSQNGQSAVVAQLLGQKTGGFFVEAGAYNGEDLSNTLYFERELNWTGLLVEPDPWNYYALKKRRRKAYSMGACLSSNRQIREVRFKQSDTMGKVVPENFPGKGIFTHQTCFPLHVLLLALEQNHVDFLSLDVEGLEEEVLMTFPFNRITVSCICVEVAHLEDKGIALKKYLEKRGFSKVQALGDDWIFLHKSVHQSHSR